jgi:hypothetical protein
LLTCILVSRFVAMPNDILIIVYGSVAGILALSMLYRALGSGFRRRLCRMAVTDWNTVSCALLWAGSTTLMFPSIDSVAGLFQYAVARQVFDGAGILYMVSAGVIYIVGAWGGSGGTRG